MMFVLIKKMFIESLTDVVRASNHTKCMSLSNQVKQSNNSTRNPGKQAIKQFNQL